ncbi:MAG TPA: class I SAM-dependent methyltransferase, partial [Acidimicrobiia bacterium]
RHVVVGIDISERQLQIARRLVSSARFECADVTTLSWEEQSLDAIAAFYSLGHVPRGLLGHVRGSGV